MGNLLLLLFLQYWEKNQLCSFNHLNYILYIHNSEITLYVLNNFLNSAYNSFCDRVQKMDSAKHLYPKYYETLWAIYKKSSSNCVCSTLYKHSKDNFGLDKLSMGMRCQCAIARWSFSIQRAKSCITYNTVCDIQASISC